MIDWILSPARLGGAAALLAGYGVLCAGVARRLWRERQAERRERQDLQAGPKDGPHVLVAYASQTGQAEALARESARVLHAGGCAVRLLPVQALALADLQACSHSVWVLSTTGEGDAPDHAQPFVRQVLERAAALPGHADFIAGFCRAPSVEA